MSNNNKKSDVQMIPTDMFHKGDHVVVVTDAEKRGVFAGKLRKPPKLVTAPDRPAEYQVELDDMRIAVYWSQDVRGLTGLCQEGPKADCRVSPAAPGALIVGVICVLKMTEEAWKAWEAEPWEN